MRIHFQLLLSQLGVGNKEKSLFKNLGQMKAPRKIHGSLLQISFHIVIVIRKSTTRHELLFNWPIYLRLIPVRLELQGRICWDCCGSSFTYRIRFQSPKQQCQSIKGIIMLIITVIMLKSKVVNLH